MSNSIYVLRDTREKTGKGWFFKNNDWCQGTKVTKLKYGDYSIEGMENKFVIERKGAIVEFANNLISDFERFKKQLDNMKEIENVFIVMEFDFDSLVKYPFCKGVNFGIRKKIKIRGNYLLKRVVELMILYPNYHFIFAGENGYYVARSILKRFALNDYSK